MGGKRRGRTIGLFPWLEFDAEVKKWACNSRISVACLDIHMRFPVTMVVSRR